MERLQNAAVPWNLSLAVAVLAGDDEVVLVVEWLELVQVVVVFFVVILEIFHRVRFTQKLIQER